MMCPREAESIHAAVNFWQTTRTKIAFPGEMSRSCVPTFIRVIEPRKADMLSNFDAISHADVYIKH